MSVNIEFVTAICLLGMENQCTTITFVQQVKVQEKKKQSG